jgi:hypothetical protein
MYTRTALRRRLYEAGGEKREVAMEAAMTG